MSAPLDVVVTGLMVVDILVRLPETVRHGEKHEVADLVVTGGAPAGNAACILGRLGWQVGYFARLGSDTISSIARDELTRCGVRSDLFIDDPLAVPGVAVVQIDPRTGERTVFYNLSRYRWVTGADIRPETVRDARLVLVDGYETAAALAALQAARQYGIPSVLDVEAGEPDMLRRILALGSHAILPLAGAQALTGRVEPSDVLRDLARLTGAQLVVTDGRHGSWALTPGGIVHQPAFTVQAVDTTGCGDAYHGAYASALLDGWPLAARMEFAAFVASRVALEMGGRANLPTRQSLRDHLPLFSPGLRQLLA